MSYSLKNRLVIAVASSALFDLSAAHRVFTEQGLEAYRRFQRRNENEIFEPGVAFSFIRRLLSLNGTEPDDRPVEVILLSRNDPDTGLRVLNSIEAHGLDISRAAFVDGREPFRYMRPFNCSLFLSADPEGVAEALRMGFPAGTVMKSSVGDDQQDDEVRVAFDFDGVLADDEAETVFQTEGLDGFERNELEKAPIPHNPGPLKGLFDEIGRLQAIEDARAGRDPDYRPRVRTAIFTSRGAPAHRRVVTTLREWGVRVDEVLFLGGVPKSEFLEVFRPHIFFDDQQRHLDSDVTPSVHVPFGALNPLARER